MFRFALVLLLGAGALAPAAAQPAGAQQAVDQFLAAFARGDADAMVALHEPDAVFLPTVGATRLIGREAIRGYYQRVFSASRARSITPRSEHWQSVGDDIALRTAEVSISQEFPDGRQQETPSRLSAVFRRHDDGWRIVQMHSCQQPAATPAPR